jgi:glycosyltransferase involved in cell wall biosynthesis
MNLAAGITGQRHGIPVVSHQRDVEYPGWPNWVVIRSGVYSHHVAVSRAMIPSLRRLGVPESGCSVIYDPIPAPPASNGRAERGSDHPLTIAMYSMLMPWKGHEVFLRAISGVHKRVDRPFRAVVGGSEPDGDTGYLARLKGLAAELGLQSSVEFTGFTGDIHSRLYETDILVLASIDPEPGGHVVQEAMMCGVPVIVTDDGGPSEYARDCGGGLVVPRRDVEAMADAIQRLLVDSDLRSRNARQGQEYARRAFDPVTIGRQFSEVYRKCLERRRRGRDRYQEKPA